MKDWKVLGGKSIAPVSGQLRNTSLPYQDPSVTPTEWTDIPDAYKATLQVQYDTINQTFFSQDIAASRLTLTFNGSNQGELRLDGTLIATSSAQGQGTWNSVLFTINHPYAINWYNQSFWQSPIWAGSPYLMAQAWGNSSPEMTYMHQKRLNDARLAGGADLDENVVGETLATIFANWNAQKSILADMIGKVNGTTTVLHHQVGIVGYDQTPFTNFGGIVWSTSANNNDYTNVWATETALAIRGIGFESNSINQHPGISAVSSNTILNVANSGGQKIYIANSSNWATNVKPNLTGYDAQTLSDIETYQINAGRTVYIHQNGQTSQDSYQGYGYYGIYPGGGCVGIINGGLHGGGGSVALSAATLNSNTAQNQTRPDVFPKVETEYKVDHFTGNFRYHHTDFSVGAKEYPYGLDFTRFYNVKDHGNITAMGRGWKHKYMITAKLGNDSYQSLINGTALNAAQHIGQTYIVLKQLIANGGTGVTSFGFAAFTVDDMSHALTNNIVDVSDGENTYRFTIARDGTYVPPNGVSLGLVLVNDAQGQNHYVMEAFDGTTWTFDYGGAGNIDGTAFGRCSTITYPFGVKSMSTEGYDPNKPIQIVDHAGEKLILDGNHRKQAAIKAGLDKVPVKRARVSTEEANKLLDAWSQSLGRGF